MPGKSLLFVDDDRLILGTLGEGLRDAGYAVVTADSGRTALEYARTRTFDLAILDVRMPGMSGIELAALLRDEHAIPSLFLSAFDDQPTVDMAIQAGGLGYVVKLITVAKLIPAVEAALARARDLKALSDQAAHLEKALLANRTTSVAVGILMVELGCSESEAFAYLRRAARNRREKLEAVAEEIVSSLRPAPEREDER
ncbi:MAG: response regulator [Halothiobacillaceae bacterium]|jgi:response regulator NasT|nr:response regulator [Halothiobacillaceae bacterium]MDY0050483.1 response regulator [Halothiobacillaceae bacterium]